MPIRNPFRRAGPAEVNGEAQHNSAENEFKNTAVSGAKPQKIQTPAEYKLSGEYHPRCAGRASRRGSRRSQSQNRNQRQRRLPACKQHPSTSSTSSHVCAHDADSPPSRPLQTTSPPSGTPSPTRRPLRPTTAACSAKTSLSTFRARASTLTGGLLHVSSPPFQIYPANVGALGHLGPLSHPRHPRRNVPPSVSGRTTLCRHAPFSRRASLARDTSVFAAATTTRRFKCLHRRRL